MSNFILEKVVVPWDFSEMSVAALEKTMDIVQSPSQIEIIYVAPIPSAAEPRVMFGDYSEEEVAKHVHESFVKEVDARFKNISFTTLFGDPGTEITNFARENDADLIIISSHGRTGISRLFMGSVAERVVRLAECPVLVLKN